MVTACPGVMDHLPQQLLELLLIQMLIQGSHVDSENASTLALLHSPCQWSAAGGREWELRGGSVRGCITDALQGDVTKVRSCMSSE